MSRTDMVKFESAELTALCDQILGLPEPSCRGLVDMDLMTLASLNCKTVRALLANHPRIHTISIALDLALALKRSLIGTHQYNMHLSTLNLLKRSRAMISFAMLDRKKPRSYGLSLDKRIERMKKLGCFKSDDEFV